MKELLKNKANFREEVIKIFLKHEDQLALWTGYKNSTKLIDIYTCKKKANYRDFEAYRIKELAGKYGVRKEVVEYEILRACEVIGNSYPLMLGGKIHDLRGRIKARGTLELSYRLNIPYIWGRPNKNCALYGPMNLSVINELLDFIESQEKFQGLKFDFEKRRIIII